MGRSYWAVDQQQPPPGTGRQGTDATFHLHPAKQGGHAVRGRFICDAVCVDELPVVNGLRANFHFDRHRDRRDLSYVPQLGKTDLTQRPS